MLEVLDTAGQEEYTSLRDQWIRDGEGFVLVYSITSEASFKEVERFYQLIQRVKESSSMGPSNYSGHRSADNSYYGPVPVMLVGNKSDRVTEREISSQRGAELAKRLGCDFIEASAKKSVNVEKAFYDVVRQLRMQKSAASRPRTERRTTPSSSRPKAEKHSSGRSGGNRRRRAEGGSKCVIL
jgi:GTPase KRas protein